MFWRNVNDIRPMPGIDALKLFPVSYRTFDSCESLTSASQALVRGGYVFSWSCAHSHASWIKLIISKELRNGSLKNV